MPTIHTAAASDMDAVRRLFRAYAESLDFELCFQGFEAELDALPGPYAPPDGRIILAKVDGEPVGVVAVKPLDADGVCEMKRLYVDPAHRGNGIARSLTERLLNAARDIGHTTMRLDTVASMTAARSLYRSLGFEERDPYYANPLPDVVYMEREL
jgi:ribosomal protein S18 acetylase RimI-like enzyme